MNVIHIGTYRDTVQIFDLPSENGAFQSGMDSGDLRLTPKPFAIRVRIKRLERRILFEFPRGLAS